MKAWDFGVEAPGSKTSIPGAFGTTDALTLTAACDVLEGYSPSGKNVLRLTGAEYGTFTAIAARSTFSIVRMSYPRINTGVDPVFYSSGTAYVRKDRTGNQTYRWSTKTNSASAGTTNLTAGDYTRKGQGVLDIVTFNAGVFSMDTYVSDAAATTKSRSSSGDISITRVFNDGTSSGVEDVLFLGIYDHVLSADEKAQIAAYFADDINVGIYIDPVDGDDTYAGYSLATAKKTLASATAVVESSTLLNAIYDYIIKEGTALTEENITTTADGTASRYRRYRSSGDGLAYFDGAAPDASVWTNVSGDVWTTPAPAVNPGYIWALTGLTDQDRYTRMGSVADDATVDATPNSHKWNSGGTLRAHFPAGFDPNATEVRLGAAVSKKGLDSNADYLSLENVAFRFFRQEGVRAIGGSLRCRDVVCSWNVNDGFAVNGSAYDVDGLIADGNGFSSASTDGFTSHGGASGSLKNLTARNNSGGGYRVEQFASCDLDGFYIEGNRDDIIILALTSGGAAPKATTMTNGEVHVTDASLTGNAVQIEPGVDAGVSLTMSNTAFYDERSGAAVEAINIDGGTFINGGGLTQTGFSSLGV